MKIYIISLEESINSGLADAETVEKTDKIVFLYPKGKDTISIQVHNQLAAIKAKTEFMELDEIENETDMLISYAYIAGMYAGQNHSVFVISTNENLRTLSSKISICSTFKEAAKAEKKISRGPRKPKTKSGDNNKKEIITISNEPPMKQHAGNIITENYEEIDEKFSEAGVFSPDSLKKYLSQFATEDFSPQNHTMAVMDGTKKALTEKLSSKQCIAEAMLLDTLAEKMDNAINEHYAQIEYIVRKIIE